MKTDIPVFIIASERSGTNLLRKRITDAQSIYLGPSPAHFLKHLYFQEVYYGDLDDDDNFIAFIRVALGLCTVHFSPWEIDWTAGNIIRDFGNNKRNAIQLMHYMMTRYARENGYESYICKDNYLYEFALDIASELPEAKFLYLYRDPRDFVLSQLKRPGSFKSYVRLSRLWQYEQTRAISVATKLRQESRCMFISYEGFIRDESKSLKDILSFLNVRPGQQGQYSEQTTENVQEWENLNKPTKSTNSGKYRDELVPKKIRIIESICSVQMIFLGYKPESESLQGLKKTEILQDYLYALFLSKLRNGGHSGGKIRNMRAELNSKLKINYRSDR